MKLNSVYNTMLGYSGYLITDFSEICVYHFTGKEKPWRNKFKEDLIILLKILKRSKSRLDFMAFKRYKEILLELKR